MGWLVAAQLEGGHDLHEEGENGLTSTHPSFSAAAAGSELKANHL